MNKHLVRVARKNCLLEGSNLGEGRRGGVWRFGGIGAKVNTKLYNNKGINIIEILLLFRNGMGTLLLLVLLPSLLIIIVIQLTINCYY